MKAKDLRGKSIEDIEEMNNDSGKPEEDQVAAAYENISKRLESIRKEKEDDSEKSDEPEEKEIELEEWKGPRPPKLDEIDEDLDEKEIKRATLRNLEDPEDDKKENKDEDEDDEIDPLDEDDDEEEEGKPKGSKDDDEEEEDSQPVKSKWAPKENDPLDEEEEVSEEKIEESEDEVDVEKEIDEEETAFAKEDIEEEKPEKSERFEAEKNFSEIEVDEMPEKRDPQPDSLDDLTEDTKHSKPMAGGSQDEEEYYIPNLKGPRQEGSNMGYNTHPQREGLGESYSTKGNYMEGNDPNNFFSQHQQPQAPKRANKFHLLVLVLIGIVVIGFTVYILKGGFGELSMTKSEPTPAPSAAPSVEPTPTPTPEPEIERGNFTVRVLNGTSTSGLAAKVRDSIKEDGYKTAAPGNASDTDVAQTEVRVKEGTESAALLQRLILDLAPEYEAKAGDVLDSKAAYDAEVIIGAK